jgi:hypothetical protein
VPTGDPKRLAERIEGLLGASKEAQSKIQFADVVKARYWQTFTAERAKEWKELGDDYYDQLVAKFEADVRVFPSGIGVYGKQGKFEYLIVSDALRFDWSQAQALANRIDGLAERAIKWSSESVGQGGERPARRRSDLPWWRLWARAACQRRAAAIAERDRFVDRAVGLMSSVLAAVDRENPLDGVCSPLTRSTAYTRSMETLSAQIDREQVELEDALQRSAQTYYARGMLWGTMLVALFCVALGLSLLHFHVSAVYGVAFPTGAVGALVSVLQRMSASSPEQRLKLDADAGQPRLRLLGVVRPVIGGVFGYAIFVFLKGGLLPALSVTTTAPLAAFAGLGFLGGFNERWAQDMIVGSAKRMEQQGGA